MKLLITCLLLALPAFAHAAAFSAIRSVSCPVGRIADAVADSDGRVFLAYPDTGILAEYDRAGKLVLNIRREAGVNRPFKPTSVALGHDGLLMVFDEVSRELLEIGADGNQVRSYPLAYPDGGQAVALSRIGHLTLDSTLAVWALLPDRATLAQFDAKGGILARLALNSLLPYPGSVFSRVQWSGGQLFALDFNQGAVFYGQPEAGSMRRLSFGKQTEIDSAPQAQDFAVDPAGRILLLTTNLQRPALLLSPGASSYSSAPVDLPAALIGKRLGCRTAPSGFLIWDREGGIVCLCKP